MKKLTILGFMALVFTISLGASLPTYATTQTITAPTYSDINRAVSQLKSTGQYYEYARLIQDIESGYTLRLKDDLLAIDGSLNLDGQTSTELINIAKTLPDYNLYDYLYRLITYTENWLPNYYSASINSQKEAYNAVNDAVITCSYLLKNSLATTTTANTATVTTSPNTAPRIATPTTTNATVNDAPAAPTGIINDTDSQTVTESIITTSTSENRTIVAYTPKTDIETTTEGATISVTVLPHDESDQATQDAADDTSDSTNQSNVATNLTYAATATSLAGAVLATKREVRNKNRRL